MRFLKIILLLIFCNQIFSQDKLPFIGVSESFEPIYAFINANIISSPEVLFKIGVIAGYKKIKGSENKPKKIL